MKLIKVLLLTVVLLFSISACSFLQPSFQPAYTPYPTNTFLPTYTFYPSLIPYPTYTPYPKPTQIPSETVPAVTNTPISTNTSLPTENTELRTDKIAGVWLVGSEVAVGQWRASGDCYAVTRTKNGDQLDYKTGNRSIISVPANAYTVEFVSYPGNCTWSYVGN